MKALAFADRCRDDLPGVPSPLLIRAVNECARELCRVGRLWRVTFQIEIDGDGVYPLTPLPECGRLHDIDVVTVQGHEVLNVSRGASDLPEGTHWTRSGDAIELRCDPGTGTLIVQAVLIPDPDATELPDTLYDEWIEAMQHGVKARLMASPNKAWSAPQLVSFHADQWATKLAVARSYGRAGGTTARRRSVDPWARRGGRAL